MLRLTWNTEGPDLELDSSGRLADEQGLETAVLVALFSDQRARDEDERADRRGWWGDSDDTDRFGSRLWLSRGRPLTPERLETARADARAALEWLLEEGIARELTVETEREGPADGICYRVDIRRGPARRWQHLWRGQDRTLESRAGASRVLLAVHA